MNFTTQIKGFLSLLAIALIAQVGIAQTVLIGGNQYAFQWTGDPDIGLFFSSTNSRYEFRDLIGAQEVWINPVSRVSYFRGKIGVNNTNPTGRIDSRVSSAVDVAAVIGRGLNSPTNGYLGVQGDATNFDGIAGLDLYGGYEIGVVGISSGGSATDNFGVLGYSNDVAMRGENPVSGYSANLGSSTHGLQVTGPTDVNGTAIFNSTTSNTATTPGPFRITNGSIQGIAFDGNEVQSYFSGTAGGTFFVNYYGGNVDLVSTIANPNGNLNVHNVLYMDGATDRVGITTSAPASLLDVQGRNELGDLVTSEANYVGASDINAVKGTSTPNSTGGYGYGGNFTGGYRGVFGWGNGLSYGSSVMGVYGLASGTAGLRYGVYGSASGGTTSYGVYASGNMAYTGTLTDVSDARFKQNIVNIENASEVISQLQPRSYDLKVQEYDYMGFDTEQEYGFVAQELEQVLPLLVHDAAHPGPIDAEGRQDHPIEFKSVNYIGMIPVIVAAMQEEQQQVEELKELVSKQEGVLEEQADMLAEQTELLEVQANVLEEMAEMLARLDKDLSACCTSSTSDAVAAPSVAERASLGQNVPNPFNGSTTINYYLPKGATFATLKVVDVNGSLVKEFNLQGEGLGQVTFLSNELAAGNYFYSMLIDGEMIDSKQMNIVK